MYELVYFDVENTVKTKFPNAAVKKEWDEIHDYRTSIELPDEQLKDFYVFACDEDFICECFRFRLENMGEGKSPVVDVVKEWIEKKKAQEA